MKIELRTRTHKSGNRTLYLEYYEKGGERKTESLNLFLIPEKSDSDRRVNQATLNRALKIKAERILGIEREPEEDQLEVIRPIAAWCIRPSNWSSHISATSGVPGCRWQR